jgi:hypothetical protein
MLVLPLPAIPGVRVKTAKALVKSMMIGVRMTRGISFTEFPGGKYLDHLELGMKLSAPIWKFVFV